MDLTSFAIKSFFREHVKSDQVANYLKPVAPFAIRSRKPIFSAVSSVHSCPILRASVLKSKKAASALILRFRIHGRRRVSLAGAAGSHEENPGGVAEVTRAGTASKGSLTCYCRAFLKNKARGRPSAPARASVPRTRRISTLYCIHSTTAH